jgi:dTMP kinase
LSRGIFIVFEGIDGAGKSTQIVQLAAWLRAHGIEPVLSREPTDGPWGRKLRESATAGRLKSEDELDYFIRDRTEHVSSLVEPSLAAGKWVIVDRYYYSTIAYQGIRGLDPVQLKQQMEALFPKPDRVFILDLNPATAVQRIRRGRGEAPNEFERRGALERIREIFLSLDGPEIAVIDANQEPGQVHEAIIAHLPQFEKSSAS